MPSAILQRTLPKVLDLLSDSDSDSDSDDSSEQTGPSSSMPTRSTSRSGSPSHSSGETPKRKRNVRRSLSLSPSPSASIIDISGDEPTEPYVKEEPADVKEEPTEKPANAPLADNKVDTVEPPQLAKKVKRGVAAKPKRGTPIAKGKPETPSPATPSVSKRRTRTRS